MKKVKEKKKSHVLACKGCGKYKKEVSADVTTYFCSNCFMCSPNYLRYKHDKPMILPLSKLKKGDMVVDIMGSTLKITKKAYTFKETAYYFAYNIKDKKKEELLVGDYTLVSKVD